MPSVMPSLWVISCFRDPLSYAQAVYATTANGSSQYLGNVLMFQTISGEWLV